MTPDKMRMIDALFGPPICFLLSIRRKILELFFPRKKGELNSVKTILFVKPAEMGSTILMYPMLKRAREIWPGCQFHFLVFDENSAAVEMLGLVPRENIHTIRSKKISLFVKDCLSRLLTLWFLRFDVAMDLEFFSRASAILTELSGAKSTCGFHRFTMEGLYRGSFLSHKIQYNPHIHTALSFYSMVEALQEPANTIPLPKKPLPELNSLPLAKMKFSENQTSELLEILKYENPVYRTGDKLIIINANSSELVPLRRWPLNSFIELGKKLLSNYPESFIVLTGVKSEIKESLEVAENIGAEKVINLVGKTSLNQLLVLYSLCSIMITNDSGPSHFSSLTDLPVITLFGPETSKLYGAFGKGRVSISAHLACSPCVSSYNHRSTACNDNLCMKKIPVERVFSACLKILDNK